MNLNGLINTKGERARVRISPPHQRQTDLNLDSLFRLVYGPLDNHLFIVGVPVREKGVGENTCGGKTKTKAFTNLAAVPAKPDTVALFSFVYQLFKIILIKALRDYKISKVGLSFLMSSHSSLVTSLR